MPSDLSLNVLKSYTPLEASLSRLKHLLLGLGLMAVIAGVALVYMISDKFTRPLATLAEGVRAVERGDFTYPLGSNGGAELAPAPRAFARLPAPLHKTQLPRPTLTDPF